MLTTLLTAHSRAEADQLLAKLAKTDPASPKFDTALQNLTDAVTHHVEEEETKVLPGMRSNLSEQRRTELGEAFVASRKQHLGEQPGDITREQLAQQAGNADISGTAGLSKAKLQQKVQREAES